MRTRSPSPPSGESLGRDHRAVLEHLISWESRDLLTHEEAERILAFEREEARGEVKEAPRVPLVAEVVAYLGAALAVAAAVALVGPRWEEITHVERLVGAGVIAVALFGAGWLLRVGAEPAVRRLAGVLWTMSVAAWAGFMALMLFDLPAGHDPASWAILVLGLSAGIYAGILRLVRPCVPLQVALYAATLTAVGGAGAWAVDAGWTWLDDRRAWFGVMVLLVSAAWIALGYLGRMEPRTAAFGLGALGAIYAPMLAMQPVGFGLLLGVGVAVALLVASTVLRNVAMLALGAIGLFGYLVGSIVYFLSDSIGVPFALLLSGVVLLVVSIVVMRLRRFASPGDQPSL